MEKMVCKKEMSQQNKRKREIGRVQKRESEYGRYPEERREKKDR